MADLSLSRKIAILTLLQDRDIRLDELARRFSVTSAQMHDELTELFTVELPRAAGYEAPFDITIPEQPDGQVQLVSESRNVQAPLMLGEFISLLIAVDGALTVSDRETAAHLLALRERMVRAATVAGYESMLWSPPRSAPVIDDLTRALEEKREVQLYYVKPDGNGRTHVTEATVIPVRFSTGAHACLEAIKDDEPRRYRLDRIAGVELGERAVTSKELRAYRKILNDVHFTGLSVTLYVDNRGQWLTESLMTDDVCWNGGLCAVTLTVSSPVWLASVLVKLGDSLHRMEPPEVAHDMASLAAQIYRGATARCANDTPSGGR